MKKIIMIIVSVLFFTSVSSVSAQQLSKGEVTTDTQTFDYPINSVETGEEVGLETIQNETIKTVKDNGITEIVLNTINTTKFYDSKEVETEKNTTTFTYKNGVLEYIDGVKSEFPTSDSFSLRIKISKTIS
ncbi:hypothetical protein KD050_09615 [Psychrobacillus sp. INOP01]|uniref:hypothetical protein n=1 Tax=Psychrobacillus sp. INOP01 TaxID=2829187 RepID=UPI001BA89378|nr:hypothetical protein [Psychrobacillus sp. INOP01]QUG43453.1 hypothetical protein KD050_09615 [Psychrobacillus sp. INOP01]